MSRIFFDRPLDTVASVWRIHRRDGVALGFTTHDRDIWSDGLLHRAGPGMVPSAIRRTVDFADDAAEIEGALSHDAIRESDLAARRYDGARVAVGAIDWETGEAEILYRGTIESVGRENGSFTARLQSAKAVLARDTIPRTSPGCRARFCDKGCTLSPARFTHRAVAEAIDRDLDRVRFAIGDPTRFAEGELRWIDGPQTGLAATVIAADADGLVLDRAIDSETLPGHRALLREGCDHTIATCATRFTNAANFQGEPHLPGNDLLTHYPMPR